MDNRRKQTPREIREVADQLAKKTPPLVPIGEVLHAFEAFRRSNYAANTFRIGSPEQAAEFETGWRELRHRLAELGLAGQIDWTKPE